jgi:hypothetical protein
MRLLTLGPLFVIAACGGSSGERATPTAPTPVAVVDACPNIAGVQDSVPADRIRDSSGNCVPRTGSIALLIQPIHDASIQGSHVNVSIDGVALGGGGGGGIVVDGISPGPHTVKLTGDFSSALTLSHVSGTTFMALTAGRDSTTERFSSLVASRSSIST